MWLLDCSSNIIKSRLTSTIQNTAHFFPATAYQAHKTFTILHFLFWFATEYEKRGDSFAHTKTIGTKNDLMSTHEDDNQQLFSAWFSGAFNYQDYFICTEDTDYEVLLHSTTSWKTIDHHKPHHCIFKLDTSELPALSK